MAQGSSESLPLLLSLNKQLQLSPRVEQNREGHTHRKALGSSDKRIEKLSRAILFLELVAHSHQHCDDGRNAMVSMKTSEWEQRKQSLNSSAENV